MQQRLPVLSVALETSPVVPDFRAVFPNPRPPALLHRVLVPVQVHSATAVVVPLAREVRVALPEGVRRAQTVNLDTVFQHSVVPTRGL